jgi:hypothetical protein
MPLLHSLVPETIDRSNMPTPREQKIIDIKEEMCTCTEFHMKKKISIRSTYVSLKVVDIRLQERIILKLCIVLLYKKKI